MPKSGISRVPTFQSYISSKSKDDNKVKNAARPLEDGVQLDLETDPPLLPGEVTVQRAQGVLRYTPHTGGVQGTAGCLVCTNFKIAFISAGNNSEQNVISRSVLIGDDDIALNNISAIYQVSHGRSKKLLPGCSAVGHVKHLVIHCKDFRTHTFNLKAVCKQKAKLIVTAIVHHAFPSRLELLFAFDYQGNLQSQKEAVGSFVEPADWEAELVRLGGERGFKVTQCNSEFCISKRLPECLVVPSCLEVGDIRMDANQFVDCRLPLWSYTHSNGASIVRMGYVIAETTLGDIKIKILNAIRNSHPSLTPPVVVDLTQNKFLPSLEEISQCYEGLREMCMPVSLKDVWSSDSTWYAKLQDSGWMSVVSVCLKVALQTAATIARQKQTVVLKEYDCSDLVAVVTCLAQMMLDADSCTQRGFERLIEREWVALGHRFTDRLALVTDQNTVQCPLFLLFLDCCYQFQRQRPTRCQFTSTYLVSLWDVACLGFFSNFSLNSARHRYLAARRFSINPTSAAQPPLPSAWLWSTHLCAQQTALFVNPIYVHETSVVGMCHRTASLHFWDQCYLRWVAPLQVTNGGEMATYLRQCRLVSEVGRLRQNVEWLRAELDGDHAVRRAISPDIVSPAVFSSAFPFCRAPQRRSTTASCRIPSACDSEDSLDALSEDGVDFMSSDEYYAQHVPVASANTPTTMTTTQLTTPTLQPELDTAGQRSVQQLVRQLSGQLGGQLLQHLSGQKSKRTAIPASPATLPSGNKSSTPVCRSYTPIGKSSAGVNTPSPPIGRAFPVVSTVSSLVGLSSPVIQKPSTSASHSASAVSPKQESGQTRRPDDRHGSPLAPVKLNFYAALQTDQSRRSPVRQTSRNRPLEQTERGVTTLMKHGKTPRIRVPQEKLYRTHGNHQQQQQPTGDGYDSRQEPFVGQQFNRSHRQGSLDNLCDVPQRKQYYTRQGSVDCLEMRKCTDRFVSPTDDYFETADTAAVADYTYSLPNPKTSSPSIGHDYASTQEKFVEGSPGVWYSNINPIADYMNSVTRAYSPPANNSPQVVNQHGSPEANHTYGQQGLVNPESRYPATETSHAGGINSMHGRQASLDNPFSHLGIS